jgi:hypothetical protein
MFSYVIPFSIVRTYRDPRLELADDGLRIRGYYLPWGTKRITYNAIRSARRVTMGALTGRCRLWGTANPRYWAALDLTRPGKKVAFTLDLGRHVRPFITPDDPAAFESALAEHGVTVDHGGRAPII